MAFSCTFPMAASAHSAMEMSMTPEVDDNARCETAHGVPPAAARWQKKKLHVPVTLKLGATLLSASVNQMSPRLMQKAAETSARLYRLPGTQKRSDFF